MLVHHNDLIFPRSAFDGYRLKGRKQRVSVSVCSQRKAVWYMTTPPPSGRRWYGHWCITEGSPQPHRSIKGDISMRFHRFILLLMFVQGYKKKKRNLPTKHDNISCSYRTMLFVQTSGNSMYCIYSIHSNVAITL